ncbi:MAG: hypothetical protein O3C40_36250, partial [Planctomycetota bacterium]|nr:hypothetical protein [Planctomycetota bacterium]
WSYRSDWREAGDAARSGAMSKPGEPKKPSRAPAPITPIRGTGGAVQIPESASIPDWKFWRTMKTVALWQAAYLTWGIDPDEDSRRDIESFGISDEKVAKRVRTLENHFGNMNTQKTLSDIFDFGLSVNWEMPSELKVVVATTSKANTLNSTEWTAEKRAVLRTESYNRILCTEVS